MLPIKRIIAPISAIVTLLVATSVAAAPAPRYRVQPWVYDPGNTNASEAAWKTGVGLPDAGKSDHALYLTKLATTSTNVASGASIAGAEGALSELGFDYRNDGHCGAGAPRFNVYTTAGTYYFFGCVYGVHTPAPDDPVNWTRVRFTNADAFPANGVTPWPGFGSVTITGIDIVFDEGTDQGNGYAYLDNIDVNGVLVGKPGNVQ